MSSCSPSCYKKHKQTPCVVPNPRELAPYQPQPVFDDNNDDEDRVLLTEEQLLALEIHEEVQRKFRDNRVKTILRRIDGAKDRSKVLEVEMKDPAFLEFCNDILEAIGVKNPEDTELSLQQLLAEHCDQS